MSPEFIFRIIGMVVFGLLGGYFGVGPQTYMETFPG